MSLGLVGEKVGMTHVYDADGSLIPVTVVLVEPMRVAQVKKLAGKDKYSAVQLATGFVKNARVSKPMQGHYTKANVAAGKTLDEFRFDNDDHGYKEGDEISVDLFAQYLQDPAKPFFIDVAAMSKGKGYAGVIKRHHFATQDASHGNSLSHRAPGSIGQNQSPGKVFKGKKMSGHMGAKRRTVVQLQVHSVDAEKKVVLLRGSIPGYEGTKVIMRPTTRGNGKDKG